MAGAAPKRPPAAGAAPRRPPVAGAAPKSPPPVAGAAPNRPPAGFAAGVMAPKSEPPAPAAGVAAPKRPAVVGATGVPKGFEAPGVEAAKGLAIAERAHARRHHTRRRPPEATLLQSYSMSGGPCFRPALTRGRTNARLSLQSDCEIPTHPVSRIFALARFRSRALGIFSLGWPPRAGPPLARLRRPSPPPGRPPAAFTTRVGAQPGPAKGSTAAVSLRFLLTWFRS